MSRIVIASMMLTSSALGAVSLNVPRLVIPFNGQATFPIGIDFTNADLAVNGGTIMSGYSLSVTPNRLGTVAIVSRTLSGPITDPTAASVVGKFVENVPDLGATSSDPMSVGMVTGGLVQTLVLNLSILDLPMTFTLTCNDDVFNEYDPAPVTVYPPEPASILLLAGGAAFLVRRRRV